MQECMSKYPALYNMDKDDEADNELEQLEQQLADDSNKDKTDTDTSDSSSKEASS